MRTEAPEARVAISGYLQILPASTGCYPILGEKAMADRAAAVLRLG